MRRSKISNEDQRGRWRKRRGEARRRWRDGRGEEVRRGEEKEEKVEIWRSRRGRGERDMVKQAEEDDHDKRKDGCMGGDG